MFILNKRLNHYNSRLFEGRIFFWRALKLLADTTVNVFSVYSLLLYHFLVLSPCSAFTPFERYFCLSMCRIHTMFTSIIQSKINSIINLSHFTEKSLLVRNYVWKMKRTSHAQSMKVKCDENVNIVIINCTIKMSWCQI